MKTQVRWLLIAVCALEIFSGDQGYSVAANDTEETDQCLKIICSLDSTGDLNETCYSKIREENCISVSGFYFYYCKDINECQENANICGPEAECNNTMGGYKCTCAPGYQTKANKTEFCHNENYTKCEDINECDTNTHKCGANAKCINTAGSYQCQCERGYRRKDNTTKFTDQFTPADNKEQNKCEGYSVAANDREKTDRCIREKCSLGSTGDLNDTCYSKFREENCISVPGFHFPGCDDINECQEKRIICGINAECKNTMGGYKCRCDHGYQTKGNKTEFCHNENYTKCEDIDECDTNTHKCGANAKCKNTSGGYLCQCERGYRRKGNTNKFTPTDNKEQNKCEAADALSPGTFPPATVITSTTLPATDPITCPAGYVVSSTGKGMECSALCEIYLQERNKTLSFCNKKDPGCIIQKSTYRLLESSCQDNENNLDIENITNSASGILSDPSWFNLSSSLVSTVLNGLLETVELSVFKSFHTNPTNQNFSSPEMDVATKVAQENCSFITITVGLNRMQVSCDLLPTPKDGAVFISYKNLDSRLSGSFLKLSEDPEENYPAVVISQVVTGSITSQIRENLNPPVNFYLNNLQVPDSSQISLCVYWDPKLSGWSQRGCNIIFSNISHTVCSCDHLSTFAVIMAPCDIKEDRGLHSVSRIGLGVSVLCLFLSLVTFLLCRSLRSAHTSMLIALCGCLFLGQLIILFGLPQTQFRILCSIIAGCLHYILLCAFCWMTLESVLLFLTVRNLNAMNYLTSRRSHFPTACIIGFGVPAVIVAISAAVRYDGYGTGKSCWLSLNLIWSFLGPVCVFITINTTLLILTFWLLRVKLASLNTNVSSLKNTRLLAFKALVQLFILGSTWILGFFQCGPGAIVASYLFTICNSLQGAFIFLVHCLLNHQVREEYRKVFRRFHIKKPESEGVSGSTVPMSLKSVTVSDVIKSDTVIDHPFED